MRGLGRLPRRPPRWLILGLLVAAIELSYVFIITAGTFTHWSTWNANYDLQAEGFRSGHLYLPIAPARELLDQRNPYDWSNVRLWFWDASLYKAHYYLYWGPFPALVLAGIKTVFRMHAQVGDQFPIFGFYTIYLLAGALLIDRMARRLFPQIGLPLVGLAIAVFAYANPTPYMLATPGIYEAAIAGAQAFLILGLVFAFDVVWAPERPRSARCLLIAAGTCWGIAIACRVSAGPPVLLLVLATVLRAAPRGPARLARLTRAAGLLAGPVALWVGALLAYNKARFESWFEFGMKYQLNTLPFLTSWRFLPANIYSYLLRPLGTSCRFPFVWALRDIGARGFPRGYRIPAGYATAEPLAGLLPTAPSIAFGAVALVLAAKQAVAWRGVSRGDQAPASQRARASAFCAVAFAVLGTTTLFPVLPLCAATMRYLADIGGGVVLFALWGAWSLIACCGGRPWWRRGAIVTFVALGGATLILGILLGFQGYDEMFRQHNAPLYQRLAASLSFCRAR